MGLPGPRRGRDRRSPRGRSPRSCATRGSTTSRTSARAGSAQSGAGEWSNKAEQVFGGKMNVAGALMLADSAEQVPAPREADPGERRGRHRRVASSPRSPRRTIFSPVAPEEQRAKLEVLDRIRDRLTPGRAPRPARGRARTRRGAEAAFEPARPRAEGPPGAPAASLRGERRARRDRVLREVPERGVALGRAQPASHRQVDGQRAPARRDGRADGEPLDRLRRDDPLDGDRRAAGDARLAARRGARRASGHAQRARGDRRARGAARRRHVARRRRGVVRARSSTTSTSSRSRSRSASDASTRSTCTTARAFSEATSPAR